MFEPQPAKENRLLRVLEVVRPFDDMVSLEIQVGECVRYLPDRRAVFFADTDAVEDSLVAKCFLPHGKMKRDAQREWKGLLFIHEHGLSGPKPVCFAQDEKDGSLWVLMLKIEGLVPLDQLVAQKDLAEEERRQIAKQMVQLLRRVHDSGARQEDQHAANWGWTGKDLYLLDAGSVGIHGSPLGGTDRLEDLAYVCLTLSPAFETRIRDALKQDYPGDWLQFEAELDGAIYQIQKRRLRRYDLKTRRSCTEFQRDESENVLWVFDRSADSELLEAFREDPENLMAQGSLLKAGNTCTVVHLDFGHKSYVLKRYNRKPLWHRIRTRFRLSRAMRSWSCSWLLKMAFVPTPRAIGVHETYSNGLRGRCYLMMQAVEGELLDAYIARHRSDPEKLAAVASSFAGIWSAMGRMHAVHGDLKASNLIVDEKGELYLFDLDIFTFNLTGPGYPRRRTKELARFMKNWSQMPEVAGIFEEAVQRIESKHSK